MAVSSMWNDQKFLTSVFPEVYPVNPANMNGVEDNTELMYLNDPHLLANVRAR